MLVIVGLLRLRFYLAPPTHDYIRSIQYQNERKAGHGDKFRCVVDIGGAWRTRQFEDVEIKDVQGVQEAQVFRWPLDVEDVWETRSNLTKVNHDDQNDDITILM